MMDALIDMGCGRTLMKQHIGRWTSKVLRMCCIHGDMKKYKTKWAKLVVDNQLYHCKVRIVPQLDCTVLVGQDYPLLAMILRTPPPNRNNSRSGIAGEGKMGRITTWGWRASIPH